MPNKPYDHWLAVKYQSTYEDIQDYLSPAVRSSLDQSVTELGLNTTNRKLLINHYRGNAAWEKFKQYAMICEHFTLLADLIEQDRVDEAIAEIKRMQLILTKCW